MVKLPPQVTGISPKEGPPGTRVTLRGENLGNDARDLIGLKICGVDCLMSAVWKSPKQIIARTGQAKGKGDIIVVTKSGGSGTSTVQFRGFQIQIGPLQESAIWVDETQLYSMMANRGKTNPAEIEYSDDPLGICDESNDKKPTEEELQELLQEGSINVIGACISSNFKRSGNTNAENFDPAWFLLENHQKTSFDDLKSGLAHLKHRSLQHEEGPFAFAKTNLTTFLDCFDTLTEMNAKLQLDEKNNRGILFTSKLEEILIKANRAAEDVFQVVLGRKDKADATRNTLGVFNRFKLLFFLPSTIDRNIEKGDYDLVITDYTRAKSLSWLAEIPIFNKVFEEIENKMTKFRNMLYEKLMMLPTTIEEQKKYIRYITHLEVDGDPAWECILNNQKWIIQLMHHCRQDHISKEVEEENQKNSLDALIASSSSASLSSNLYQAKGEGMTKSGRYPSRVMFVDILTKIVCNNFPNLWRLGLSYVNGKLMKEVRRSSKADLEKQTKFSLMMQDIIVLYLTFIRCAFLPHTVDQSKLREEFSGWTNQNTELYKSWLPICVKHVRFCVTQLALLDLPQDSLELLQTTNWLLRSSCVETFLNRSILDVRNLGEREIWTLETDDKHGSTTVLPVLFEGVVNELVHTLQEVINNKAGEKQLFSTDAKTSANARESCTKLLQDFSSTLLKLASLEDPPLKPTTTSTGAANMRSSKMRNKGKASDPIPAFDKRLIIIMNNCSLTTELVIPRLVENLNKHGYPVNEDILPVVLQAYKELDRQLFMKYVDAKANPIIGSLEQNMHCRKFNWNSCPPSKGVKSYIKESIHGLLEVHAEVYSIGPAFMDRVLCNIIEHVAEELSRLFQCASDFNDHGALQARLDLEAFESSIDIYKTPRTGAFIKDALNCVPHLTPEQTQIKDKLLMQFRNEMKFHLLCFIAA